MNICAVRGLAAIAIEMQSGSWREQRERAPLPHEPEMCDNDAPEKRFLWPVDSSYCNHRLRACRHCGALYLESGRKDESADSE